MLTESYNSNTIFSHKGKGTSSRDGAAIAGALLEVLDKKKCSGKKYSSIFIHKFIFSFFCK